MPESSISVFRTIASVPPYSKMIAASAASFMWSSSRTTGARCTEMFRTQGIAVMVFLSTGASPCTHLLNRPLLVKREQSGE